MNGFPWSKTPLKLLLILILAGAINFGLVLGIQMLVSYRIDSPVDASVLAQLDDHWNGCEILDHSQDTSRQNLHFYLVKKADGSMHFITLRKHYLVDRYRLMDKACQAIPDDGEALHLKAGTCWLEISVTVNNRTGDHYMNIDSTFMGQHAGQQFKNQMILAIAGLCALELAGWCLLFRKEEIA